MVKYTSKNTESEGDTTEGKSSEEKSSSKATTISEPPANGSDGSNVTTKILSFWTVIGLGSVIKAPTGTSGATVKGPRTESSGSKGSTSRGSGSSNRSANSGSKS